MNSIALTTTPFNPTIFSFVKESIYIVERMPMYTFGLSEGFRTYTFTAQDVLFIGNNFQMVRIYTISYSAKVIKYKTVWNLCLK